MIELRLLNSELQIALLHLLLAELRLARLRRRMALSILLLLSGLLHSLLLSHAHVAAATDEAASEYHCAANAHGNDHDRQILTGQSERIIAFRVGCVCRR